MTETWLNATIQKADVEHYETFHADRINIKQGGIAMYVHKKPEGKLMMKIIREKCELD